jgi:DNA polymerase III subunit gamma/tau
VDTTTTSTEAPKTTDKSKTEESSVSFDKPIVNNTSALRQRPGSISITAIQENSAQKAVSTEISVNTTSSPNQAFSLSNLEKAWQQFGETIPEQGRMLSLILNSKPILLSSTEFEVTVSNIMQERELKKLQSNILEFIRSKLQNSEIQMSLKIMEETETTKASSPEERYRQMAEQNPAITTLRNGLQMEID